LPHIRNECDVNEELPETEKVLGVRNIKVCRDYPWERGVEETPETEMVQGVRKIKVCRDYPWERGVEETPETEKYGVAK
jgi:hypothetical protein